MLLPKEKIENKNQFRKDLVILLKHAEQALKEWKPIWTPFISEQLIEEINNKFNSLYDINCKCYGGYPAAERQRICFLRSEKEKYFNNLDIPIRGINIKGNFLFDRAKTDDFRKAIHTLGIHSGQIGDIWLIRDRGAQAMCSEECADLIDNKIVRLREVDITIHKLEISEMEIPFKRVEKIINTVEASTRIDAIASAGFSLSRSKVTTLIKRGDLRLNWVHIHIPSKGVSTGDLIHLEKKGSLKILDIYKTKKNRWRIKLLRQ